MPTIITRSGEPVLPASPLPQEQKDIAWEYIVRAWARKHPDALRALVAETNENPKRLGA